MRCQPHLHSLQRIEPPRWLCLVALAAALSGCISETSYVPRTPHVLALAMKRGDLALYKDGALIEAGDVTPAAVACVPAAALDATEAASEHGSYRQDAVIAGLLDSLLWIVPPLVAIGIYFGVRADGHRHQANVHLIDALNRHNDEPGCRS